MGITLSWAFWHTSISFIFVFLSVAMMALESGLPIPMFSGWSWSWVNWDEMSEWEQVLRWLPQLTSLTAAVLALLATTFCGGGRDRRGTRRLFSEPILAIAGILAALSLPLVAMHLYMMIVPLGFSLCCCFPKQCPNLDRDLLNSEVCQNHMLGHHGEGFVCKLRSWELALASVGPPLLLMACTYVAAFVAVTLSRDDEEGKGSTNRRRGGRRRGKRGRRRGGRSGEGRRGGGDQEVNDGYASADDESDEYSSGRSESGSERSHSDSGSFRGTDHSESDEEEEGEEDGRRSLETRQIELTSFASRARAAATGRLPDGTLVKASKAGWKRPHVGRVRGWDAVVEMYIVEFDAGIRRQVDPDEIVNVLKRPPVRREQSSGSLSPLVAAAGAAARSNLTGAVTARAVLRGASGTRQQLEGISIDDGAAAAAMKSPFQSARDRARSGRQTSRI